MITCSLKSQKDMFKNMADWLIKIQNDNTLFGEKQKNGVTSYAGSIPCFEICEDYRAGLVYGYQASIIRDSKYLPLGISVQKVHYEDGVPFVPLQNSGRVMPILEFEKLLEESADTAKLAEKMMHSYIAEKWKLTELIKNNGNPTQLTLF